MVNPDTAITDSSVIMKNQLHSKNSQVWKMPDLKEMLLQLYLQLIARAIYTVTCNIDAWPCRRKNLHWSSATQD